MNILKTRAIPKTARTLIVVFNRQGEIQRFNQVCETVLGYAESEVKGQSAWAFLLVPEERLAVQSLLQRLVEGPQADPANLYSQNTWIDKSGGQHRIAWSYAVLMDAQGTVNVVIASGLEVREPPDYTSLDPASLDHAHLDDEAQDSLEALVAARTVQLREINDQLRREMRLSSQAQRALKRREHQLQLVTNALPALVAYIDTYHRYRFNNYAYESWYGIPHQQITGRQVNEIVDPQVYQQMLPYLERALLGEKVSYETELILHDGQRRWVSIQYIPDFRSDFSQARSLQRVKGVFSLVSDISDLKAAERMKDEFVSVVSHELRTPLTSVHGSLKLLSTGQLGALNAQGKELIEIALNNTERLTRLINDVLDLERMGSGRVSMTPASCDALTLVRNAVRAMQPMADDYGIQLSVHSDRALSQSGGALMVWADADYIMQALTNLLSNAIKFSPAKETVSLKLRPVGSTVEFLVKDAGRGIPSDKLETIFERFQQVDTSDARERGGTGLGLAICREIIQQHQGRIWVKSVHGQGSSFYFTLPVAIPT
ncbi:MAG: ATP-binding protein [Cyanobacteria bacterium P01_A01_bin.116]